MNDLSIVVAVTAVIATAVFCTLLARRSAVTVTASTVDGAEAAAMVETTAVCARAWLAAPSVASKTMPDAPLNNADLNISDRNDMSDPLLTFRQV